jgi:ferredoxin-type protein NapG
MKRKDLFRKALSKAFDAVAEASEEILHTLKADEDDLPKSNQKSISEPEMDQNIDENYKSYGLNNKLAKNKEQINNKLTKKQPSKRSFLPKNLQRPPGAVSPDAKFNKLCTGCSECTYSCPYGVIFPIYDDRLEKNIPFMDVNANACMLCEDTPCIQSCETGALKPLKNGVFKPFGQAKGIFSNCINHQTGEKTCNACQDACPIPKTVIFRTNKPSFTKSCIGCGLCVKSCPTYPKAIRVI